MSYKNAICEQGTVPKVPLKSILLTSFLSAFKVWEFYEVCFFLILFIDFREAEEGRVCVCERERERERE